MRHKHAGLINAWADGREIQVYYDGHWIEADMSELMFGLNNAIKTYRIKPKEPNWWENIPHHGILVRSKNTGCVLVFRQRDIEVKDDFYPLTNEEIERFKR